MRFREIERIILKVTIPNHSGDLDPQTVRSILKQAGL